MVIWKRIILFVVCLLCACLVEAQITATQTSGCAPLPITFTAPSGVVDPEWDFGDQASSLLQNPDHTYGSPGTYTVTLTDLDDGSTVGTLTITVFDNPTADFSGTPTSGCVGLNVAFTDLSTGGGSAPIVKWDWAFGDGGRDTINQDPNYVYTLAGSFDASLIVIDQNGCTGSITKPDYVTTSIPPTAVLTSTPTQTVVCDAPFDVSFSAAGSFSNSTTGSGLTYSWDFGDSTFSNVAVPPTKTYTTDGTYNVILEVTDNNGCTSTATKIVSIGSPTASFEVLGAVNDTVCPDVTFISHSSPGVYFWTFGDNSTPVGGTDTSVSHTYQNPGTYNVRLQVFTGAANCTDDTTITVVVEEIIADFNAVPSYSCEAPYDVQLNDASTNAAAWDWDFGDGGPDNVQNPVYTYEKPDISPIIEPYYVWDPVIFDITLIATSLHGCKDTISKPDTLFIPTALLMADTAQGCAPLPVTFSDSSVSNEDIVSWHWFFGDGTDSLSTVDSINHVYQNAGEYDAYLVITNSKGCTDTSFSIRIVAGNEPSPNFTVSDPVVCPDEEVTFMDLTPTSDSVDTWHYETDDNHAYACQDQPDPTWAFNYGTGPMDITLTVGYNGCYADTTIDDVITVLGPLGKLSHTCSCDSPYVLYFHADNSDVDSMAWDFGDSTFLFTTTETNPRHVYDTSGNYMVILTTFNNGSGCPPYADTIEIKVRDIHAQFEMAGFDPADTLNILCTGVPYAFNADSSRDVHEYCNRGYRWDFEEASPPVRGETPDVDHAFISSGIHDVRLIVRDENYCEDTVFKRVKVFGVDANFSADSTLGCIPLPVNFTDSSTADTTIDTWSWTFLGATPVSSTSQNPSVVYNTTGIDSFIVLLQVTDVIGCSNTSTGTIRISVPDAGFTSSPTINCGEKDTILFDPDISTHTSYVWAFGDGDSSTSMTPTHIFNDRIDYPVTLAVTDSLGCSNSNTELVRPNNPEYPVAGFSSTVDNELNELCFPRGVDFTDTTSGIVSRVWDFGTGNPIIGAPKPGFNFTEATTYTIELVVTTAFGCKDTVTRDFVVRGPSADVMISTNTICKGQDITFTITDTSDVFHYVWDFGTGVDTANVSPVTHTYDINPASGQTLAQLIYYSGQPGDTTCPKSIPIPINIHPVIADFDRNNETDTTIIKSDTVHCIGETDVFTNRSEQDDIWSWDFGDGRIVNSNDTNDSIISHTYASAGLYEVELAVSSNSLGCKDTTVKTMLVNPIPDINAQGDEICQGESIQLMASSGNIGDTCLWQISDTNTPPSLNDATICDPVATPNTTTDYFVIVTDSNGCSNDTTIQIFVYDSIDAVTEDYEIIIGDTVHLKAESGPFSYFWSPDYEISCLDCENVVVMPLVDTIYKVAIRDTFGCFADTSTYKITVSPNTDFDVPTAFTPNSTDGNQRIKVRGWGIKSLVEFRIFNRWGQKVFDAPSGVDPSDDIAGWDGTFNGKVQDMDSYFWTATVELWVSDGNSRTATKKGTFHLLK